MKPPAPLVSLVDDPLPERQFRALHRAIVSLGRERIVAGYQTTFWFDFARPPSNLVEQAVLTLRERIPSRLRRGVTGVEWWLSRMRTSNVKVDFHRDRDNARFDETGEETHPQLGSVLYLNACRGGLLAVTEEEPNPANPACAPDVLDLDVLAPRANRYCWFRGDLPHGVLDARNQIPGARLPTERAWRLAIAINYWRERPWGVPTFDEAPHYRKLALATARRGSRTSRPGAGRPTRRGT
ncbi:MAG: hypothetical protein ACOZQL_32155 [Myxococcota bacterium]